MNYSESEIWNESVLVFDSSSILRLYEWYFNKSLELKDIFDCKTQSIVLLEQVKKETTRVFEERIELKKDKYLEATNFFVNHSNKEKALRSLKKQSDGYKYSEAFLALLQGYLDETVKHEEIIKYINITDHQNNLLIEENKLSLLFKEFFSSEFLTKLTQEEIEEKYNLDKDKGLPGYKDKAKGENKMGDYIILNQLVEIANENECVITFITADVKPDWFPFNQRTNQRELNPSVIKWFSKEIVKKSQVNVITLVDLLKIAQKYISDDITRLVDETIIYSLVEEMYGEWYPEDLMDKVTEYIEENSDIQLEIESAVDSCLDYLQFGENEDYSLDSIDYIIDGDEVIVKLHINFYLSLDASAYAGGETMELGSPSCHFAGIISGAIPLEWKSKQTGAISIDSQLEEIEIESITLLSVTSLYPDDEDDHGEPDDYYEQDEYDEPDNYYESDDYYEPEEYDEPEENIEPDEYYEPEDYDDSED